MRTLVVLLSLLALVAAEKIMVEVSFDLALNQESASGYTAAHTVNKYLADSNLLWLRYLSPLISGQSGASMRTAMFEFIDSAGWAQFEQTHLADTHVLYDLFWINWKRVMWREIPADNAFPRFERTRERHGGYLWAFKFTSMNYETFRKQLAGSADLLKNDKDFLEARVFEAGSFQSDYNNLVTYEFNSLAALEKHCIAASGSIAAAVSKNKGAFQHYSTTVWVPTADPHGGVLFLAAGHPEVKAKAQQ